MKDRAIGHLHWILPGMLVLAALRVLLSGRDLSDLSRMFMDLQQGSVFENPVIVWGQRALSILVLLVTAERVANHIALRKPMPSPLLTTAFIVFWLGTVASPALFGAHPLVSHEFLYPLLIGIAFLLATGPECDKVIDWVKPTLFGVLLVSVILAPVKPSLTVETLYNLGLFPGMPRLAGLAPHAIALSMYALTFLVCLWCRPFARPWLNRFAWLLGLGVLLFSQSKTSWIALVVCAAVLLVVRNGSGAAGRLGDPRRNTFGVVLCVAVIVVVTTVMGLILGGSIEAQASSFLDSSEGAQLTSLTGRDQIWAVALEEWHQHPVFGYGPALWDEAFRASIRMPNATHGHNEFLDTLARAGSVGAATLVFYAVVLLFMSVRYAKASGGLSLALFLFLALRSISEVPLLLFGYGTELLVNLLLLVTLASAASRRQQEASAPSSNAYRVAS